MSRKRINDNRTLLRFKNFFDGKKFTNEIFNKNKENLVYKADSDQKIRTKNLNFPV